MAKAAEATFTPKAYFKMETVEENGKKVKRFALDEKGNKITLDPFKSTKFEDMVEFMKGRSAEEKEEFKKACHTKNTYKETIGKKGGVVKTKIGTTESEEVNTIGAKNWFFEKYAPEYIKKAAKKTKTQKDLLAEL